MDSIKAKHSVQTSLPGSLQAWRDIDPLRNSRWAEPWEVLRCFFTAAGYELYRAKEHPGEYTVPMTSTAPASESFGLYGDRSKFASYFPPFAQLFAARDRMNRDVVIKVISKGEEGANERRILEILNSEPLRSDPANATIPVLDFLEYEDYCFAVMPCCDSSSSYPFLYASECLDFAEQSLEALCFLHKHRIAHLDISFENIVVNHHGEMPEQYKYDQNGRSLKIWPPLEWRSTFPVRYCLLDFGISVQFPEDLPLSRCTILPFPQGREHRAPETLGKKAFNPFAADVYQMARLLYAWFTDLANDVPDLLKLLQDMSYYNPSGRITASTALSRLRTLRTTVAEEKLTELRERDILHFLIIPRSNFRLLREILEAGNWSLAGQYTWWLLKSWFYRMSGKEKID
ncbi:kinase-like domain-containing protein [Sparassis latifolia]